MKPRFIVEQKITALVNRYSVYSVLEDGSKGNLGVFVEQKRFAFKESVRFFKDSTKQELLFTFKAEKVMDIHGKFLVKDPNDALIGYFKKEFAKSLTNSTWSIYDHNDVLKLSVNESNRLVAVLRRFAGWIPIVGELVDAVMIFVKYHFSFYGTDNTEVGKYEKTTLFRDHYVFSMSDEAYSAHDWRVFVSMAIALDALQAR